MKKNKLGPKHVKQPKPTSSEAPPTSDSAPEAPAVTVYTLTGAPLDPKRKGLVVAVAETLQTLGTATAAQVTEALLASGAYQKVAPKAAAARPLKPVQVLLKEFATQGIASER